MAVGLRRLVYVSTATTRPTQAELEALLEQARERNLSAGITGLLLCHDGNYAQAIEGPPAAIDRLWAALQRDPRHRGLTVILDQLDEEREFGGWAMAFRHSPSGILLADELPLDSPRLGRRLETRTPASRVLRLLHDSFR
jgi:hypothetical protein